MTRGVAGRPRKVTATASDLRHLMTVQTGIEGYADDGTPLARPGDAIDSANWTRTGRIFGSMKATNGPVYVDEENYYTTVMTARRIDAKNLQQGQRVIREDSKVYMVALPPIDLDDVGQWSHVMLREVVP